MGWKRLTKENWLETDPVIASGLFVQLSLTDGQATPMGPDSWAERILEPELASSVPAEVRGLFDVARGAMLYGSLFYPLFTLGLEQLYRVGEAAVTLRVQPLGLSKKKTKTFENKLDALQDASVLTAQQHQQWSALRGLRNEASHPERQTILAPGHALSLLHSLAAAINHLFP